jgi:hypothetical protein
MNWLMKFECHVDHAQIILTPSEYVIYWPHLLTDKQKQNHDCRHDFQERPFTLWLFSPLTELLLKRGFDDFMTGIIAGCTC